MCSPLVSPPTVRRYIPRGRGPKTNLMRWSKKGGTGKNENFHGGINRLVAGVARIGVEACDARLLQRVCRHNLDMDRKLGNTSKQSTRWPWRERVVNNAASGILASLPFPKAPPDPNVSPIRSCSCRCKLAFCVGYRRCALPCTFDAVYSTTYVMPTLCFSCAGVRSRRRTWSRWGSSSTPP